MAATDSFPPSTSSSSAMPVMEDREVTPSAQRPTGSKYRGAVVEDLQLSPAFCLPATAPLSSALEMAYEREFDHLPILNEHKRPIGYLDVPAIKRKFEQGIVSSEDVVRKHTTFFRPFKAAPAATGGRNSSQEYRTIHPETPLEVLERFLDEYEFALVTDPARKWVLAVATRGDLQTFVQRRGFA